MGSPIFLTFTKARDPERPIVVQGWTVTRQTRKRLQLTGWNALVEFTA